MEWALLLRLPNLRSLTLTAYTGAFASMAMLLRLPRLEKLSFMIDVGPEGEWKADVQPEDILESIISSTERLKSWKWEDMSGSTSFPVKHNASKLKQIVEQHAVGALEHLDIVCGINDRKDWRLEQERTEIAGHFGPLKNFIKLADLSIQLEVLLGKPEDGLRLKDVIPLHLQHFTGLTLPDYHVQQDSDRIWEGENFLAQFEELAKEVERDQSLVSLQSVRMHLTRKNRFDYPSIIERSGQFGDDGILGQSRIQFAWF